MTWALDLNQASILRNYNNILKSCNALDYHDLISCSVKLLNDFPEGSHRFMLHQCVPLYMFLMHNSFLLHQFSVLKECQDSWKAIIVDEFQDTSAMQYSLLQVLSSHSRVTIVGDDDQVQFHLLDLYFQEVKMSYFPHLFSHLFSQSIWIKDLP